MSKILTEQQLLQRCRKGDRSAQFTLYQQYKVYLFGITQRYGKTREEAEDILQEGFYRIFKDLHQYNGSGPFRAWMRKVMVNTSLMYIRKNHKIIYTELESNASDLNHAADTSLLNSDRAKEIALGKNKKNLLGFNGKIALSGGNRITAIDLAASKIEGDAVYVGRPFEDRSAHYYRFDVGVSYKMNRKNMTHTIMFDIQNITNRENLFEYFYNENTQELEAETQTGLFPFVNYRIEF